MIRRIIAALCLYSAALTSANAADVPAALGALRMHDVPQAMLDATFIGLEGEDVSVADITGKVTVLNFWATWCAPCLHEMPALSRLATALGDDAQVVTVATGRNPTPALDRFFQTSGITNLPRYLDPKSKFAQAYGVLGLPVTVILDEQGQEIARLQGDAEWDGKEVVDWVLSLAKAS